jgi:predicted lipid-binding transport protein (Tim44 family)
MRTTSRTLFEPLEKLACHQAWRYALPLLLLSASVLHARAGGAGGDDGGGFSGGDSGGGGGDGGDLFLLLYFVFELAMMLPFPLNIIVLLGGAVVAVVFLKSKAKNIEVKRQGAFGQMPDFGGSGTASVGGASRGGDDGSAEFLKRNPGFDQVEFLHKVDVAFPAIQEAWSKQDLAGVRRFISDGVYQRFTTQFLMMKRLKQTNELSDVQLLNSRIDRYEADGEFDILHVLLQARVDDQFVCEGNSQLDTGGTETFVEAWSFLRKRGRPKKDIYDTDNCPACGAPLPADLGEVSTCPHCSTLINSGEFDWVLAEITQADDYARNGALQRKPKMANAIAAVSAQFPDSCTQLLEDKASNAYMQILAAQAEGNVDLMRRFVSKGALERLSATIPAEPRPYHRLFLRQVTLTGALLGDKQHQLFFELAVSYQRVQMDAKGKISLLDPFMVTQRSVLQLVRDVEVAASKGSLYQHRCPACAAPLRDTAATACAYCNAELNSPSREWIVEGLMSTDEYRAFLDGNKAQMELSLDPSALDELMGVRGFALANCMVVMAADGQFANAERQIAGQMARKFGFDPAKLDALFAEAQSGRLALKMPDDPKARNKIYAMMEKVAKSDGKVSPEEAALLAQVREQYLPQRM